MRTRNLEGIIISRKNIGEADKLLAIFTKEEGKIKAVARGSRKIKSRLASQIELFDTGNFQLVEGKTFNIVAGAETRAVGSRVAGDLNKFRDFSYLCEILKQILPEGVPFPELYTLTVDAMTRLQASTEPQRLIILDYFTAQLLRLSGFLPDILQCDKCGEILIEQNSYAGGICGVKCSVCAGKGDLTLKEYKLLRLFYAGGINQVLAIKGIEDYHPFLERQISPLLLEHLPNKLKSKQL